ncbi:hypothetical protein BSKO_01939 [Bryopsis sp. KO-2023]|nr:hypothetical protein BSKO_01939 [Bryopsis sp. KO-2023]
MNSVEAVRVLAVLDEALDGLRLLSSVTPEVLESAAQVKDVLDQLRACTHKQLTTSVEEDKSNQEHFQEVKEREERAFSEKTQLEQKLKLQRIERQKQLFTITSAEEKAKNELAAIQTETEDTNRALEEDARRTRQSDNESYNSRRDELTKELQAASSELAKLYEDHKDMELQARKAKTRAEHDVEGVLHGFDEEMASREEEYQEALGVYNELQRQIEEYREGLEQLTKERLDYEAEKKRAAEEKRKLEQHNFRVNRAAKTIQKSWKGFKAQKESEKKKGKKEKGGKKGKK